MLRMTRVTLAIAGVLLCAWPLSGQWTNRYQRIGQGHHVYIEGYDFLPTPSAQPIPPSRPMAARWRSPRAAGSGR